DLFEIHVERPEGLIREGTGLNILFPYACLFQNGMKCPFRQVTIMHGNTHPFRPILQFIYMMTPLNSPEYKAVLRQQLYNCLRGVRRCFCQAGMEMEYSIVFSSVGISSPSATKLSTYKLIASLTFPIDSSRVAP